MQLKKYSYKQNKKKEKRKRKGIRIMKSAYVEEPLDKALGPSLHASPCLHNIPLCILHMGKVLALNIELAGTEEGRGGKRIEQNDRSRICGSSKFLESRKANVWNRGYCINSS